MQKLKSISQKIQDKLRQKEFTQALDLISEFENLTNFKYLKHSKDYCYEDLSKELNWHLLKMKSKVKGVSSIFYSISAWLQHLRKYDFTFGMRLHGNVLAMQAGVPCLLVAHDSRTKGLAKAMSIPYVLAVEFNNVRHQNPSWYFDKVAPSIFNYEDTRIDCANKFKYIFDKSNIKISNNFNDFINKVTIKK